MARLFYSSALDSPFIALNYLPESKQLLSILARNSALTAANAYVLTKPSGPTFLKERCRGNKAINLGRHVRIC